MEEENVGDIAHRMIHFFYDSMAIGRDAWEVAFWDDFLCKNADIRMDSRALRSFFFEEIMYNGDYFDGLQYEVVQYINPLFNRIRADVMEYRDLVEGIDFVFDRQGFESSTLEGALPPLQLQSVPVGSSPPLATTKRCITPTTEQILRFVSDGLSELVWTEDEKQSKPSLTVIECLQRVALLTQNGIPLLKCIEPGMSCYERFRRLGALEAVENETVGSDGSAGDYGQFQAPQGISTPLLVPRSGLVPASRKDSALGQSIQDEEKNSAKVGDAQPGCSYQTPSGRLATPNYDATLKRIRFKPGRFNTK